MSHRSEQQAALAARLAVVVALLLYPCSASATDSNAEADSGESTWRIKTSAEPLDLTTWQGWVGLLGGVEVSGSLGSATVTSGIERESGDRQVVASGNASQSGFGVSIFPRPRETGFSLGPTGGYLSQSISIADFVTDIPTEYESSDGQNIGGTCSDPSTGETRSCRAQNVYDLDLASGYAGAQASANLVVVAGKAELFATLSASANAIEYRQVDAEVYRGTNQSSGWRFFRSFGGGLKAGWIRPDWHLGLRAGVDFQRFLRFEYDKSLEFRTEPLWDPERQTHVRERVFVNDASINIWTFQVATAFVF